MSCCTVPGCAMPCQAVPLCAVPYQAVFYQPLLHWWELPGSSRVRCFLRQPECGELCPPPHDVLLRWFCRWWQGLSLAGMLGQVVGTQP